MLDTFDMGSTYPCNILIPYTEKYRKHDTDTQNAPLTPSFQWKPSTQTNTFVSPMHRNSH